MLYVSTFLALLSLVSDGSGLLDGFVKCLWLSCNMTLWANQKAKTPVHKKVNHELTEEAIVG